jgi:hypothetical protein
VYVCVCAHSAVLQVYELDCFFVTLSFHGVEVTSGTSDIAQ